MAPHAILPHFYTTPELFGVKEFLTLSGGWENPYDIFAQQAESKLFRNNAIISSKSVS
jgi:porin